MTAFNSKQKYEKLAIVVCVAQTKQNFVISRFCFAVDCKEMYKWKIYNVFAQLFFFRWTICRYRGLRKLPSTKDKHSNSPQDWLKMKMQGLGFRWASRGTVGVSCLEMCMFKKRFNCTGIDCIRIPGIGLELAWNGGSWGGADQFWYIQIQPKTIYLITRLWGITTEVAGFIPQSLERRSIVLGWIVIYLSWSISFRRDECNLNFKRLPPLTSVAS